MLADIGPYFLVTLIAPYFIQKISYFTRISTVFMSGIVGLLMLAFSEQVYWKLIGVGITSFGYGVGEVTFLALTSFYHQTTLSAYSAGTGTGFVIAPLYYTGRTWEVSLHVIFKIAFKMCPLGFLRSSSAISKNEVWVLFLCVCVFVSVLFFFPALLSWMF